MPSTLLKHSDWQAAQVIVRRLIDAGHTAYLAGGCVRDALLGRMPKDLDIATSATADEVQTLFPDNVPIGKEFGVVLVKEMKAAIEVTTFRVDGPYLDGRRPSTVQFRSAKEDARRRDFTVNALFYDMANNQVIDYVGGVQDISNSVLRAVGESRSRFEEDRLRVLRAIRFTAQLDFTLDNDLEAAIKDYSSKLGNLSKERVTTELLKTFKAPFRNRGLQLLQKTGCWQSIWPELSFVDNESSFDALLHRNFPDSDDIFVPTFLATLIYLESEYRRLQNSDQIIESLLRFTFPAKTIEQVRFCLENLPVLKEGSTKGLLLLNHKYGLTLMAFAGVVLEEKERKQVDLLRQTYLRVADKSGGLPANFIDGDDLKSLGVKPGPAFKEILQEAYLLQLEGKIRSKEEALNWVSSFW